MQNFNELNIQPQLKEKLFNKGFKEPTEIQAKSIPLALENHDLLATAQTGTGKTLAFAIPMISKILSSDVNSLILLPTRELAIQVMQAVESLLPNRIKPALLIGGDSMGKQLFQLKKNPRIIIGTAGRINDHIRRKSIFLKNTKFLVLDEVDRMLDMGFAIQLEEIFKFLPADRQTLMFSATLPKNITNLAHKYLNDPQRVAVGTLNAPAKQIRQSHINVRNEDKYDTLTNELRNRSGSIIIFIKTKIQADKLAIKLKKDEFKVNSLHGDLRQNQRLRVIQNFKSGKTNILVATDIASRGLDIPHIEHVINYELPQCPEDYVHRIGRTARAGKDGEAVNFITKSDGKKWKAINRLINPDAKNDNDEIDNNNNRKGKSNNKKPRTFKNRRKFNTKKAKFAS